MGRLVRPTSSRSLHVWWRWAALKWHSHSLPWSRLLRLVSENVSRWRAGGHGGSLWWLIKSETGLMSCAARSKSRRESAESWSGGKGAPRSDLAGSKGTAMASECQAGRSRPSLPPGSGQGAHGACENGGMREDVGGGLAGWARLVCSTAADLLGARCAFLGSVCSGSAPSGCWLRASGLCAYLFCAP